MDFAPGYLRFGDLDNADDLFQSRLLHSLITIREVDSSEFIGTFILISLKRCSCCSSCSNILSILLRQQLDRHTSCAHETFSLSLIFLGTHSTQRRTITSQHGQQGSTKACEYDSDTGAMSIPG